MLGEDVEFSYEGIYRLGTALPQQRSVRRALLRAILNYTRAILQLLSNFY